MLDVESVIRSELIGNLSIETKVLKLGTKILATVCVSQQILAPGVIGSFIRYQLFMIKAQNPFFDSLIRT